MSHIVVHLPGLLLFLIDQNPDNTDSGPFARSCRVTDGKNLGDIVFANKSINAIVESLQFLMCSQWKKRFTKSFNFDHLVLP